MLIPHKFMMMPQLDHSYILYAVTIPCNLENTNTKQQISQTFDFCLGSLLDCQQKTHKYCREQ